MSITDELRKYANTRISPNKGMLTAIADRIDAEHESACAEAYGNGVMSVPIALDESAWVELPKDADGVPIHVGDVMEWPDGETFDVIGIGEGVLFYTESECDGPAEWTGASTKRHHHAPTVEDVLREFADGWDFAEGAGKGDSYMKTFAAKLRLAEGEDA